MNASYDKHGFCFRYPTGWVLSEQEQSGDVTVTVTSPDTSFWTLSLLAGRPRPAAVIDSAVDTYGSEYAEIDVYPVERRLCDRAAVSRDVEFVCYDLINTACLRAVEIGGVTALVLFQGTDDEFAGTRNVLEAITASLSYESRRDGGR